MAPGSLSDEVARMRRAFETTDLELERVSTRLRDLSPSGTGPADLVTALDEVVHSLERRLGALAVLSRETAAVTRRHGAES